MRYPPGMSGRLLVIDVVGLVPSLMGPRLAALAARGWQRSLAPVFPAVTCTAQASMLTGRRPDGHGIVAYGWYTLSPETAAKVGSRGLVVTWPLVAFGVWRLRGLLLDPHPERGGAGPAGGDPVELVLRDRACLATAALWLAACLGVVYRPW